MLCGAGDEDAEVARHMVPAAQALGALVPARHWLPLAAQAASARSAAPEARACALVVLSALLYGAGTRLGACVGVSLGAVFNPVHAGGACSGFLRTLATLGVLRNRYIPAPVQSGYFCCC